jgi:hypothetical protein
VRERFFPADRRTMLDMHRSGAVEALAGNVDPGALGAKMANSIASARELQNTYLPGDATVVRQADEARLRGRSALRSGSNLTHSYKLDRSSENWKESRENLSPCKPHFRRIARCLDNHRAASRHAQRIALEHSCRRRPEGSVSLSAFICTFVELE